MKRLYKYFFGILGISFALTACDDWLDTEIKDPANLTISNKDEAYYAVCVNIKRVTIRLRSDGMVTGREPVLLMRIP